MRTSDFDYHLPKERIAQQAIEPRDHSRLMVLSREKGSLQHRHFYEIVDYIQSGDLVVCNDSRVIPARLLGHKVDGGGRVELLLLRRLERGVWEALARPVTFPGIDLSIRKGPTCAAVRDQFPVLSTLLMCR